MATPAADRGRCLYVEPRLGGTGPTEVAHEMCGEGVLLGPAGQLLVVDHVRQPHLGEQPIAVLDNRSGEQPSLAFSYVLTRTGFTPPLRTVTSACIGEEGDSGGRI